MTDQSVIVATITGSLDVVEFLIKQHANVNTKGAEYTGWTELGANFTILDDVGRMALSHAAGTSEWEIVTLLVKHGADVETKGAKSVKYI